MSERKPIGLSVPHRKTPPSGMKCPECGAPTDVKETRLKDDNTIHRRRLCFNGHRFFTREIALPTELVEEENRMNRVANLTKGKK
jgi:hypothetical protein